jgi:adenylate cyclase, class 2
MRNIELKARLRDRGAAVAACERLEARLEGDIRQVDTYFRVPEGRLKLRESDPGEDYLVFYQRPDVAAAKACDYSIQVVPRSIKTILSEALGVIVVVDKVRTLYLWENVRIHLDAVQDLGAFVEFEAVLDADHADADGHAKLVHLQSALGIAEEDLEEGSYLDLIRADRT